MLESLEQQHCHYFRRAHIQRATIGCRFPSNGVLLLYGQIRMHMRIDPFLVLDAL